jgi:hypothetical protein
VQFIPKDGMGIVTKVPFVGAQEMSLQQAQDAAGFQVPRPDDPLASDSQITGIWEATNPSDAGKQTQIEVDYCTGVYVQLEPAIPQMTDHAYAARRYQEMAAEDASQTDREARATTVNGSPAYLVPDGAAYWADGESQGAPGAVSLVVGTENIEVVGHLSSDDLLRIAATVATRPA